jgi:hypothetical protein
MTLNTGFQPQHDLETKRGLKYPLHPMHKLPIERERPQRTRKIKELGA